MKNIYAIISLCFLLLFSSKLEAQQINPNYDLALADTLGADDYGMKSYILAILKSGPIVSDNRAFVDSCFQGHMKNISRLVEIEKLVVAGPLGANEKNYRGIFILNVTTIEEAQHLLATDPAINEQLLAADFYRWYGSAALSTYLPTSDKIWKVKP